MKLKKIFLLCRPYLKNHKTTLFFYIFLCIVASIISLASPYISGNFIDFLVGGNSLASLAQYCILYAVIGVGGILLGYFNNKLYIKLQTQLGFELNRDTLSHIQKLPLSFMNGQDSAYLSQRINNDANTVVTFTIGAVQNIFMNIVSLLLSFYVVFILNTTIALILFVLVPCYYIAYRLFKKLLFKRGFELKEMQSEYFGKLFEQLLHIKQVKIHSIGNLFLLRLNSSFERLLKIALRYQKTSYAFSGLDSFILTLAQIFLFMYGGFQVISGQLSVGQFTIISSYFVLMMNSIRYFFSLGKNVQDCMVSYKRLSSIFSLSQSTNGSTILDGISSIYLKEVSVSFNGKKIISNFTNEFRKGKIYTIRGANGSGKSTLINLILGLYIDECEGVVFLNNMSIRDVDMVNVRNQLIGVTEQEPVLFEDSIRFNITFNCSEYTDADIIDYMSMLGLDSFIDDLPLHLDTVINEKSSNISGGEKQKIALIRTFLKNPDVMVLDEPSSALDAQSRQNLKEYLVKCKEDKIIIIVTHDDGFSDVSDETVFLNYVD